MRASLALFNDVPRRSDNQPKAADAGRYPYPGWIWLGYTVFGIAFWTGVGVGIHALVAAL